MTVIRGGLFAFFLILGIPSSCLAQGLPTTAQFSDFLRTCATNANIEVNADLIGSIETIYAGQKTQGLASFRTSTKFLELFPEAARLDAYRVYTACIAKFMEKH